MKRLSLLPLACCLLLAACNPVRMDDRGVTIRLKERLAGGPRLLRLEVVSEDIIRVMATPAREFAPDESLIACYSPESGPDWWGTRQGKEELVLETPTLNVTVSLRTGEMTFTDRLGNVLLREVAGGGKTFSPIEIDGSKLYSFRQVFESPGDEAFYGLGQHQSDEFNYKGRNETLFQYNTKVSVPFVVSSFNYGLLWDNYSLTRWGDPRDYADLDQFSLYDRDGNPGGLTATYVPAKDPETGTVVRVEKTIDYENLETVKKFPEGFSLSNSTVTWEGEIESRESGKHFFKLYYAGYIKLYINDDLIVPERWRTAWNPNSYKFNLDLQAGRRYNIRIEWRPDGSTSYLGLKALSPVDPEEQGRISLWSEAGKQMDFYFIHGENPDKVISGYRTVTGKAQIMPRWSMGFWQSRERYKTQAQLLEVLREFRAHKIPIDNIVQDWSYWPEDAWGSHDFDPARYPDPQAMVDSVHALGARIMISVWPKFYRTTEHYKQFDEHGWIYRRAVQDSVRDWIGRGYIGSFYDAYSAGARKLFWQQMDEKLARYGFDAWWMDAPEPDILSNAGIDYRKALMNPTALGSSTEFFNAYGLMNAKGIYEGQRRIGIGAGGPDKTVEKRVFLLTRSGFAGSQRYAAAIWSGDIATRWEDMKAQITAGLNFSISGNPYWTMDNGGFCVEKRYEKAVEGSEDMDEWRELNVRWHQFGAFVPLFRTHGQYPFREVWNVAPESHPAYSIMVDYTKLRYRLMPYIYSLCGKVWLDDYTIMRPLAMDFSADPWAGHIGDQYMFGPSLMVCPVYEYKARTRKVYLPERIGWYDFYTGKCIDGAHRFDAGAPLSLMPIYVPAGSIIPAGGPVQSTAEPQRDLTIYVYEGSEASFDLYEDDGISYGYEDEAYSRIRITWNQLERTLTVGRREGSYPGYASERTFSVVTVSPAKPAAFGDLPARAVRISYDGKAQTIKIP